MKSEELAFFNLQLAGMIKSGIPLEGALKELSSGMSKGKLRTHIEQLDHDLSQGKPLEEALDQTNLPRFYCQMVKLGARSGHLTGMLTMVADYYQRLFNLGSRLKGMLVYPAILLVITLAISLGLRMANQMLLDVFTFEYMDSMVQPKVFQRALLSMAPVALCAAIILAVVAWANPRLRSWIRWHLPGFKETELVKLASSLSILLQGGLSLQESVAFLSQLENDTRLHRELNLWKARLESGQGRFQDIVSPKFIVPPLFVWLVSQGGEDLSAGFDRAAALYQSRADYRFELFLYAVLPVSILALGLLIMGQMAVMASILENYYNALMEPL